MARPSEPPCIFTVSQGIAATVTAHQAGEIGIEKGRGGERKMGREKKRSKDIFTSLVLILLYFPSWK